MNPDELELCFASATNLLQRFKSKDLSPVDVVAAMIKRAEEITPSVNPYADTFFEQAYDTAVLAEQRYQKGTALPLDGLPLLIKDNVPIKGTRATVGSNIHVNSVADASDPSVDRLLHNGSIFLARSTCPEFCWLYCCYSRLWGVTRNPWRLDISPGGSSGGSAAALACGGTTLAIGTDSTGSTRQPASQCGVVGYKPPFGRNPAHYAASYLTYNSAGPMARTVNDIVLMQNVMSGQHALDPYSQPKDETLVVPTGDIKGKRIACSMDLGCYEIDPDVRQSLQDTIAVLEDAGATVEHVEIDWAEEAIELAHKSEIFLMLNVFEDVAENHLDQVSGYMHDVIARARSVSPLDYGRAKSIAGEVWHTHLGPLFEQYDALITPTVSCPEVPVENGPFDPIEVNGKKVTDTDTSMNALFNMFNQCPALSVPCGLTRRGLPVGAQVVSKPYDDQTVMDIGRAIESGVSPLGLPKI